MNNKKFVIAVLVVALLAVVGVFMSKKSADVATLASPEASKELNSGAPALIRPNSRSIGNVMARVTVVEWFDPECESCRRVHPAFKKIVEENKSNVRFVMRFMPYHTNSLYASCVLEEAAEAGKFDEALDILFDKQEEWGSHENPQPDLIPGYLAGLGIPGDKLARETVIAKHGAKIKLDEADGNAMGVNGTPTFFVNGRMVQELSEGAIREAIKQALDTTANR